MGSPNLNTAEHHWIETNGIRLHVFQAGPKDGPLVILLHGFPEFWYGWRYQIPYLASAGYRVWVPDQRGYNLSDKPAGVAAYRIDVLAADVIGLVKAAGRERTFLVGHDWGGAVAWWAAAYYPQCVDRMVVINAPQVAVMWKHLRHNPAQLLRSWYIFFFQIPWLPEAVARLGDWKMVVEALRQSSRPNTFSEADLEIYKQAWSQPKAYTCMLNWYRAILRIRPRPPVHPRLSVPTLLIWGARDRFLGRELAQQSIDLCSEGRLVVIEEATHWVQHEEAEHVNTLIADFLGSRGK
jgi:epoxide hydrolase 4